MFNPYNNQLYINDLQAMRDKIDRQLQQVAQTQPMQPQSPITQNFQIAPNQQNSNGIKYVSTVDEVKKELVFNDSIFVNKEFTLLWFKNASGDIKSYGLKEIIELDEKDVKINELEAKINMLLKEKEENEQYASECSTGATTSKKSTNGKSN